MKEGDRVIITKGFTRMFSPDKWRGIPVEFSDNYVLCDVTPYLIGMEAVIKRVDPKGIVLSGVNINGYYKKNQLELIF